MHKQWIGCAVGNFLSGRAGFTAEAIVIHRTGGTLGDIDTRCKKAQSFNSAHYAVGVDGHVHQYVEENDTAFHAGIVVNPTWKLLKTGKNPNLYTIAIEVAGSSTSVVSDTQYDAIAALIVDITARWQIAADADHIVLHSEIRAGLNCPGDLLSRDILFDRLRASAVITAGFSSDGREVEVIKNTNVRERAPSTMARIVRVIPAGATETATGFTDQGDRVKGNAYWFRTEDGHYFWAGSTGTPHPTKVKQPALVSVNPAPASPRPPAQCGIQRIDDLFAASTTTAPVHAGDSDRPAVGAVQDLLTGHGFSGMPSLLSSSYGVFGPKTVSAVADFQKKSGLTPSGEVDASTIQKLVGAAAPDPRASQVYLALALGFPSTGMNRILSLVAQMEGVGKFAAINANSDRAGLSFGLIQWAQRPGRLTDILVAMSDADREQFVSIFGEGDETLADALIAHTRKFSGGVDPTTGVTVSRAFDLVNEPWLTRFRNAALVSRFQEVQVQTALTAFENSFAKVSRFAPVVLSERGVGFMLDIANQFGDVGAEKLYNAVHEEGMAELDLLEGIADESVERMPDKFKAGVRARRDRFLETTFLSDKRFASQADARAAGK